MLRWMLLVGLIVLAVISRFLPHPPNFTPVIAIALFAGAFFESRWMAFVVSFAALIISDFFLGWYPDMPVVYGSLILITFMGFALCQQRSVAKVGGLSLAAAVIFFVLSNLGVWALAGLYPLTATGLQACFVAAIPFFHNTLLSTLLYAGLLFGAQAWMDRTVLAPVRA